MNLSAHRISGTSFSELAAGGGGAKAVGELCAAQASKNRLLVRLLVDESRRTGHRDADLVARAYESLADVEAQHPEEVGRCLRYPAVGAWALRTHRAMPAGGGDPGRLAAVALAAAIRAGAPALLEISTREGMLMLPSVGRLTLPDGLPDVVKVTTDPSDGGAELRFDRFVSRIDFGRDTHGWQALRQISGTPGILLTIDDLDPYRWPGDDAGGRLSNERWQSWTACVRRAWRLLKERHETVAEEVAAAVSVLTPLTTTSQSQHSACARDVFGTIALTDPLDGMGMAATLAHELQHAKLNALTEVVDLVGPDDGRRYYAPWRSDPRPLFGLLHGAYAHAGVVGFWRRHTEDEAVGVRAQIEFARWREDAHHATGTLLDSGGLTAAGVDFVSVLRDTLGRWRTEPVSPAAIAQARLESERHREEWTQSKA